MTNDGCGCGSQAAGKSILLGLDEFQLPMLDFVESLYPTEGILHCFVEVGIEFPAERGEEAFGQVPRQ